MSGDTKFGNALISAVHANDVNLMKSLTCQGADLAEGQLLDVACCLGHITVTQFIVEQTKPDRTVLSQAVRFSAMHGRQEIFKYLVSQSITDYIDRIDALKDASRYGLVEGIDFLLNGGTDIHAANDYALRIASSNGHLRAVRYLVEYGANIHAKRDSAFRVAVKNDHFEIVNHLFHRDPGYFINITQNDDELMGNPRLSSLINTYSLAVSVLQNDDPPKKGY